MATDIRIEYTNVPSGAMENSTTTATNKKSFVNMNDFKTQRQVPKFATLEQGRNMLDGTFINTPTTPTGYGYISSIMSRDNCTFASTITITRTYAYNYTAPGLMIEFDTWTNEFPRTMTVTWYHDDTQLEQHTYDVDSALYFCDTQVSVYNKIVITISNMIRPNRYLKIFNIYDGVTRNFYNEEIENLTIIEEIDSNNKALALNQSTTTILPANNTGVQFQRTLPFMIYRNEVLYGKFYINTSTSNTDKSLYKIRLNDWVSILEGQTYLGGTYSSTTTSTIIAELLGDIPYTLDATLGAKTITGYLPILNKREALREIAFAINGMVDTSRTDKIIITPFPSTASGTLTKADILSIESTQQSIITKYILNVKQLELTTDNATEIFSGTLNGTKTILFSMPYYDLQITGGTIVSSNCNYAIISGTGSSVVLSGKSYEETDVQYEKVNSYTIASDLEKTQTFNTTIVSNVNDMLNNLHFVEYKIKSKFKMGTNKVGDIVSLNGQICRITRLTYDIVQTTIYCSAELEAYYE